MIGVSLLESQKEFWAIGIGIYILLSIIRKSVFPAIGFIIFTGLVIGREILEDELLTVILQNMLYIYIGVFVLIGYSFIYVAFTNKYLNPRDELILSFYGILLALPAFALTFMIIVDYSPGFDPEEKYVYSAIATGIVLLIIWGKVEKFYKKHEKAYLESVKEELFKNKVIQLKSIFGDKDLEEIEELALAAIPQDRYELHYCNYLGDMAVAYLGDEKFDKALSFLEKAENKFSSMIERKDEQELTFEKAALARILFYMGVAYEAKSNLTRALENYREASKYGDSYYVKSRILKLENPK